MKISQEDVEKVALLARLELREEEKAEMAGKLSEILTYVEQLNELDTENIEPMTQVLAEGGHPPTLRDDENRPSLTHEEIVRPAPDADDTYFKVPKVLER